MCLACGFRPQRKLPFPNSNLKSELIDKTLIKTFLSSKHIMKCKLVCMYLVSYLLVIKHNYSHYVAYQVN